ncbi:MAG: flagellar hook-basal body complex protein [Verrucomicrobiota bacterium]
MKSRNLFAALIFPLLFASDCGSLMPVLADSAEPAIEARKGPSTVGTNCAGHVLALGNANEIRLLAAALRYQRINLEVIANNLANIDTTAFKASQLRFQDMTSDEEGQATVLNGAEPVLIKRLFAQGELRPTGNRFDLAIKGIGFFEVEMPDGTTAFTRDGSFQTDTQGRMVTCNGYPLRVLQPVLQAATGVSISDGGQAIYSSSRGCTMFQAQLARFVNPDGLYAVRANLFKETVISGSPELGNPCKNGFGSMQQGYLETSNVNLLEEKAHLVHAQQVYEVTLLAMQVAEKMHQSNH